MFQKISFDPFLCPCLVWQLGLISENSLWLENCKYHLKGWKIKLSHNTDIFSGIAVIALFLILQGIK
jgi:hypothetical protein